jgi:hypothetical protein
MKTVCVDLNGVLDQYTGWKGSPEASLTAPRPGAVEFLQALQKRNFRIVVFTTVHAPIVRDWLREHKMDSLVDDVTDRKAPAFAFIDDRAICFRGDFDAALDQLDSFRAHWEAEK